MQYPPPVKNAVTCSICQSPADRQHWGFQCQANSAHYADLTTGLFEDHTFPEEKGQTGKA